MRKLASGDCPPEVVAPVLDDLESRGLLSDQRFAENYIRHRFNRGFGPVRIRRELQEKGVAESLTAEALARAEIDWYAHAHQVWRKKFGQSAPKEYKERARQARFLQYRGFGHDHIQQVLDGD